MSAHPSRPTAHGGFIALGTLTVSALSSLVLMTACQSVDDPRDGAVARRCPTHCAVEAMPHLMPFDEQFVAGRQDD